MRGLNRSLLWWLGGAVVGALVAPKHRVAGALLGAVIVGATADTVTEHSLVSPGSMGPWQSGW